MNSPFNIADLFFYAAEKHPDNVAIIYKNQKITYQELCKQVKNTSSYFLSKGIKKGDRVLVFVPMSIDLYRIVLSLFNIGATAVFLDEWVNKKRMEECCKIAQCTAFIGIFKALVFSFFSSELRKIPIKLGNKYTESHSTQNIEKTYAEDTALITFTTGSTGTPKAAKRTHGFLKAQFDALIEKINPSVTDVDMPVLPVVLLINLGIGCTSVITNFKASKPDSMKCDAIVKQLIENRVSRIVASPFFIKKLAQHLLSQKKSLPHLEKIFTGGAPVFPDEAALYNQAFSSSTIEIVYGSTEAEPISSFNAKQLQCENIQQRKGLCVGRPDKSAKVKIIKITENPIECNTETELHSFEMPANVIGEIIVSGNHVLREYFNNENALKRNKIFINQTCWHRTGDSGFIDSNGNLFLTGRCASLIHYKNEIISPFVYEGVLQNIENINMGTVLLMENKLCLVLELQKQISINVVHSMLADSGLQYDTVKYINKIPRDPRHNSKIDYEKLKSLLSQHG